MALVIINTFVIYGSKPLCTILLFIIIIVIVVVFIIIAAV